jgi:endonuclease G
MGDQERVAKYISRVAHAKSRAETLLEAARGGAPTLEGVGVDPRQQLAQEGVKQILRGQLPTQDQTAVIEAIILPKIRPVLDVVDGDFRTDHPLWDKLNNDQPLRNRLRRAIPAIGRIELPGHPDLPYGGTGFVVGKNLVMTNRHVAAIFSSGVGTRRLAFKPGRRAGLDFRRELDRPTGPTLPVRRVVMVHPFWDMALLEVEGLPPDVAPLELSQREASAQQMIEVAAIGYPAFDTRNDAAVQNDLFRKVFGVKRLQPGTFGGRQDTESFGKLVPAARHNCSTLGGNSGSALIDLESGHVVALHFGGRESIINWGVPGTELARDDRIVQAGVTFAAAAPGGTPPWANWWSLADEERVVDAPGDRRDRGARSSVATSASDGDLSRSSPSASVSMQTMPDGSVNIVVPLHVTLRLGGAAQTVSIAAPGVPDAQAATEAMVMPFHDEDYDTRVGYKADFLGTKVPMPKPTDAAVVAKTIDGDDVLHYQNFSIIMHAKRRMALLTASNVTAEAKLKKPEPGRVYTRKALSGLGKNDQEKWFPDPRLADEFQLPDVFFTRDEGAFDKGHIVRREDVAWGSTYDLLRIANGDTYHLTNCSPQVAGFNRSTLGDDNWGDLEDHVLKGASSERYCQFAGPVLDPGDEVFLGRAGGTKRVRVKIPSRYWKVIAVRNEDGIASYGFVLEQDLSDVPFEEFVAAPFKRFMVPITDLEGLAGVTFPQVLHDGDRFDTNEGMELAFHAGLKRGGFRVVTEEGVIV